MPDDGGDSDGGELLGLPFEGRPSLGLGLGDGEFPLSDGLSGFGESPGFDESLGFEGLRELPFLPSGF